MGLLSEDILKREQNAHGPRFGMQYSHGGDPARRQHARNEDTGLFSILSIDHISQKRENSCKRLPTLVERCEFGYNTPTFPAQYRGNLKFMVIAHDIFRTQVASLKMLPLQK